MTPKILTLQQEEFVAECVEHYGIDPEQIKFEGEELKPIFDKEARNRLRLVLTNISAIEEEEPSVKETLGLTLVSVKVIGRSTEGHLAKQVGTAIVGEKLKDGTTIADITEAQNVASARAERRVLRALGIDLVKAHRSYLASGAITPGQQEFADPIGRQIKALATETGHISDAGDAPYRELIQSAFGHKTNGGAKRSMLDLDDIERSQLVKIFESILTSRKVKAAA